MPLKVHRFEVYLNPLDDRPADSGEFEPVCHEVRVLHVDQLMGEVAFTKAGLDMTMGMNLTNAWCYAACQRLGLYPKNRPWAVFRQTDCAGIQAVQDPATGEPVDVDVDPTRQSPSGDSVSP